MGNVNYSRKELFAQFVSIKLALPMAKHIFMGKSVVLHLFDGPELRTHY